MLFLILLLFGLGVLYPWVTNPALAEKKKLWLNVPFMSLRIAIGVAVLYWTAALFTRAVFAEGTGGRGEAGHARRNRLGTILLMLFVVVLSLWGFDLLMSLDPIWYSGLFGGYYVVTSMYTGFGLVAFLTIRANARGLTRVSPAAIQDIAKLVFAMCVMWMYFFYSQYLVIWYGNVPVETRFFLRRFFVDPWRILAFVILIVGALLPFGYLLKRLTGRPPAAHTPLMVVIVMGWTAIFLERIMLVFPSISADEGAARRHRRGADHRGLLRAVRAEPELVPLSPPRLPPRGRGPIRAHRLRWALDRGLNVQGVRLAPGPVSRPRPGPGVTRTRGAPRAPVRARVARLDRSALARAPIRGERAG